MDNLGAMRTTKTTQTSPTAALLAAALAPTEALLYQEFKRQLTDQKNKLLAELAVDGWDANKRYSYPSGSMGRERYFLQKFRYDLCQLYTENAGNGFRGMHDPDIRNPRTDNATKIDRRAAKAAKDSLAGFVVKMTGKVDALRVETGVKSISYQGGLDPWGHSHITVELTNGDRQLWRTQMIVNVSCLGKLFNQWPTRLVS